MKTKEAIKKSRIPGKSGTSQQQNFSSPFWANCLLRRSSHLSWPHRAESALLNWRRERWRINSTKAEMIPILWAGNWALAVAEYSMKPICSFLPEIPVGNCLNYGVPQSPKVEVRKEFRRFGIPCYDQSFRTIWPICIRGWGWHFGWGLRFTFISPERLSLFEWIAGNCGFVCGFCISGGIVRRREV